MDGPDEVKTCDKRCVYVGSVITKILSQAEVNEVYAPIKSDHEIFGFDVTMNEVAGMNAFQCIELEKSVNISMNIKI